MSEKILSEEVDKQLESAFSTYVVGPVDSEVKIQLFQLQKKWFGDEQTFDPDTPYLETVMDSCLQRVSNKLDKLNKNTEEQHHKDFSLLQDIRDNVEDLNAVEPAIEVISKEVLATQSQLADIKEKQETKFEQIIAYAHEAIKVVEAQAECLPKTIVASAETMRTEIKNHTEQLVAQLKSDIHIMSEQAEKNNMTLCENAVSAMDYIKNTTEEMNRTIASLGESVGQLAEQQDLQQKWQREIEEKIFAEKQARMKMLYILMALNGLGVVGVFTTLLLQLLG